MPEGDTIFRASRTLHRALAGETVTQFETQLPQLARVNFDSPIVGRVVESVKASGKWMYMNFSGDLILVTHMLMSGSWHIYRSSEPWQRGRQQMRVALSTDKFVAVAFNVPIAEFHTADTLRRHRSATRLGPDVLASEFDVTAAAARFATHPELEVGEALLSQSIIAGLGNVFKSEVSFASGVNPFRLVGALRPEEVQALMSHARRFMLANVTDASGDRIVTYKGFRTTTGRGNPNERLWVYGRRGEPCRRCGTSIQSMKQGLDARVTFWCPRCQG